MCDLQAILMLQGRWGNKNVHVLQFLKIRVLELTIWQSYFEINRKKTIHFKISPEHINIELNNGSGWKNHVLLLCESDKCYSEIWTILFSKHHGAYLCYCYSTLWDVFVTFLLFLNLLPFIYFFLFYPSHYTFWFIQSDYIWNIHYIWIISELYILDI